MSSAAKTWKFIAVAVILALTDAYFKIIALKRFPLAGDLSDSGFVSLGLHKNYGAAFGINISIPIIVVLSIAILAFLAYFVSATWKNERRIAVATIIVIIGALGNLIDRVINRFTTDYILFSTGSAINISDILIVAGVLMIVFHHSNTKVRSGS